MQSITILGGGPAGASAALAALADGSPVTLCERAVFPRHKVCGEFLSPEIAPELDRLGVWSLVQSASPAPVRRMLLHFGSNSKQSRLPETAWGLSRYAFDHLLLEAARVRGAEIVKSFDREPTILASGRPAQKTNRGKRLFGFKAHFEGPTSDTVELYFFNRCYVGVSPIESGLTNVCGLGPEEDLARFAFDYDGLLRANPPLRERTDCLRRHMPWLSVGPLAYRQTFDSAAYLAGDALSFVDPFTGSGLLAAIKTGALAGRAAARNTEPRLHSAQCRATLNKPFAVASVLRNLAGTSFAHTLAALVPGRLLFGLTRPR